MLQTRIAFPVEPIEPVKSVVRLPRLTQTMEVRHKTEIRTVPQCRSGEITPKAHFVFAQSEKDRRSNFDLMKKARISL